MQGVLMVLLTVASLCSGRDYMFSRNCSNQTMTCKAGYDWYFDGRDTTARKLPKGALSISKEGGSVTACIPGYTLEVGTCVHSLCANHGKQVFEGALQSVTECVDGIPNGRRVAFNTDGSTMLITQMKDGVEHGTRYRFLSGITSTTLGGGLLYSATYVDGRQQGVGCWYGPLKSTDNWVGGEEVGAKNPRGTCRNLHGVVLGTLSEETVWVNSKELIKRNLMNGVLGNTRSLKSLSYSTVQVASGDWIVSTVYAEYTDPLPPSIISKEYGVRLTRSTDIHNAGSKEHPVLKTTNIYAGDGVKYTEQRWEDRLAGTIISEYSLRVYLVDPHSNEEPNLYMQAHPQKESADESH